MSGKATEDEILELIQLVDHNFEFNPYYAFFHGNMAYPFVSFIALIAIVEVYLFTAPTHERIVTALAFLAVSIAFLSLMSRFIEKNIVDMNFERFGMCVEGDKKPLLKALIKMKTKNHEIELEQIYNLNKSIFSKEKLLERLYE